MSRFIREDARFLAYIFLVPVLCWSMAALVPEEELIAASIPQDSFLSPCRSSLALPSSLQAEGEEPLTFEQARSLISRALEVAQEQTREQGHVVLDQKNGYALVWGKDISLSPYQFPLSEISPDFAGFRIVRYAEIERTPAQLVHDVLRHHGVGGVFSVGAGYPLGEKPAAMNVTRVATPGAAVLAGAACGYLDGMGACVIDGAKNVFAGINNLALAKAENRPVVVVAIRREGDPSMLPIVNGALKVDGMVLENADDVRELLRLVVENRLRGTPVYIEIPEVFLKDELRVTLPVSFTRPAYEFDRGDTRKTAQDYVAALEEAQQPFLYLGDKIGKNARLRRLVREFAEVSGIPVSCCMTSKGAFPEYHRLSLGMYAGPISDSRALEFVNGADVALLLGTSHHERDKNATLGHTTFPGDTTDVDGKPVTLPGRSLVFPGNADDIGDEELVFLLEHMIRVWREDVSASKEIAVPPIQIPVDYSGPEDRQRDITLNELPAFLTWFTENSPGRFALVPDIGMCAWAGLEVLARIYLGNDWVASMGFSMGTALGIPLALPGTVPLVLTGDGALQMMSEELRNIMEQGIPCAVVLLRNDKYRLGQGAGFKNLYQNGPAGLGNAYTGLAESMGGETRKVTTFGELQQALREAQTRPLLIEVLIGDDDRPNFGTTIGKIRQSMDIFPPKTLPTPEDLEGRVGSVAADILKHYGIDVLHGISGDVAAAVLNNVFTWLGENVFSGPSEKAAIAAAAGEAFKAKQAGGLAAGLVTWHVGGFNALPALRMARDMRLPLALFSGCWGTNDLEGDQAKHHCILDAHQENKFDPREMMNICAVMGIPALRITEGTAEELQDLCDLLEFCRRYQSPVYVEIARDVPRREALQKEIGAIMADAPADAPVTEREAFEQARQALIERAAREGDWDEDLRTLAKRLGTPVEPVQAGFPSLFGEDVVVMAEEALTKQSPALMTYGNVRGDRWELGLGFAMGIARGDEQHPVYIVTEETLYRQIMNVLRATQYGRRITVVLVSEGSFPEGEPGIRRAITSLGGEFVTAGDARDLHREIRSPTAGGVRCIAVHPAVLQAVAAHVGPEELELYLAL